MDSVSAVRSQLPVPASQSSQPADRVISQPAAQSTRPVDEPMRRDAVHQPSRMVAQVAVEFADRDEDQHPAAEARAVAQAARDAYIKASIAAGINPLPVP